MEHKISDQQIFVTDQLDWFKFVPGNRHIDKMKVGRMEESMRQRSWLHLFPVVVDNEGHIWDGQHRVLAARGVNFPVYYVVDKEFAILEVARTNSIVTAWDSQDYLNFWAVQGELEYKELEQFLSEYPRFSINNVIRIRRQRWSKQQADFREGRFEFVQKELCQDTARLADWITNEIGIDWAWQRNALIALATLVRHPEFDESRFQTQLTRYHHHIVKRPSIADFEYLWQDLYNMGHSVNRVIFKRLEA